MSKDQRIRDPIHNLIKFSSADPTDVLLWEIIQTKPFQRLRRIRQLGFSEFVYPGATHSRFAHCVGALQMARRMFEVLEKNQVLKDRDELEVMKPATLAAVLLHDIGHGPYSHVFEEVSESIGRGAHISHEEYTHKILHETKIEKILSKAGILELTASFFEHDPKPTAYSSIVSSQLDADRLDFLTRDRYFTGIQFGSIDREWLFDSLRIDDITINVEPLERRPSFVVTQKGLPVLEEYLSSYAKLYESVYFHKTTRGIQILVDSALKLALNDLAALREAGISSAIIDHFQSPAAKRLSSYLTMDDADVIVLLKALSNTKTLGESSKFAQRFFERDVLACLEPSDPNHSFDRQKIGLLRDQLVTKKIWHHIDIPSSKGYKQYDLLNEQFLKNIMVAPSVGSARPIGEIKPDALKSTAQRCRFYFLNEPDKLRAEKLWRGL